MTQSTNQTIATEASVDDFVNKLNDPQQQKDSQTLIKIMQRVSGAKPTMWGPAIIGFGTHHYKYDSGREGDEPEIAFSPRVGKLVVYIMTDDKEFQEKLKALGPYKTGKICLYIKRLADIDLNVLESLIEISFKSGKEQTAS